MVDAAIDVTNKSITATLPATTDLTKLVPTITLSDKATISPAKGVAQDFSKEVSYTVTDEDGSTQFYKVNVKKEELVVNNTLNDMVFAINGNRKLFGFDATTGSKKWEFSSTRVFTNGAPAYHNGILYVSNEDKKIYAIDAKNSLKKWEYLIENSGESTAPVYSNGLVYCGGGEKLFALDAESGVKKWEYKNSGNAYVSGTPTILDGLVYFNTGGTGYSFFIS